MLVQEKKSIYSGIELSLRESSYVLYAHALMTQKSCTLGMRNAMPRNHFCKISVTSHAKTYTSAIHSNALKPLACHSFVACRSNGLCPASVQKNFWSFERLLLSVRIKSSFVNDSFERLRLSVQKKSSSVFRREIL